MIILIALLITMPVLGQTEIEITKTAKAENPTLFVQSFDGRADVLRLLKNTIHYANWFDVVEKASADYYLSAYMSAQAGTISVEVDLVDGREKSVVKLRKTQSQSADPKGMIYELVDEIIEQVFHVPGFCRTRLAYVKEFRGAKEVWTADFNGQSPIQVTKNNTLSVEPNWGNGTNLLTYTKYNRANTDVVLVDLRHNRQKRLTNFRGLNSGAALSRKGDSVAMTLSKNNTVDLYVCHSSTGQWRQLTDSRNAEASPCWSPDDREICYVSEREGGRPRLYIMPADGGTPQQLLKSVAECVSPDWSSVSNKICFSMRQGSNYTIAYIDMTDSSREPIVLVTAAGDWESPSWAADGRHIVCSRNHGGMSALYLVDSTYRKILPLMKYEGNDTLPSYSGLPR